MNCEWVKARMDQYMDRELGNETPAMDEHLASCVECGETLAARQALRLKLRGAADDVVVPAHLHARIRTKLDRPAFGWNWGYSFAAVAAALVLIVGGLQFSGRFRQPESEETMMSRVESLAPPVLRVGLRDHVHCALFQKYPAIAPSLQELTGQLGPDFSGLVQIVQTHVPKGLKVIEAHHCTFGERRYIHVVARHGEQWLSLVITPRGAGEAFETDLKSVVSESGVDLYSATNQDFQIAGFETGRYLTYLISNTGQADNLAAMRAMTPALRDVFRKVEI